MNKLFAYGTLQEGSPAHEILKGYILKSEPVSTPGIFLEAEEPPRRWFPAAIFENVGLTVHGTLYTLNHPGPNLWNTLDAYEGVHAGLFKRIRLQNLDAFAYEYTGEL